MERIAWWIIMGRGVALSVGIARAGHRDLSVADELCQRTAYAACTERFDDGLSRLFLAEVAIPGGIGLVLGYRARRYRERWFWVVAGMAASYGAVLTTAPPGGWDGENQAIAGVFLSLHLIVATAALLLGGRGRRTPRPQNGSNRAQSDNVPDRSACL